MYNYEDVIVKTFEIIKGSELNVTEDDIFNLLKIKNRWPRINHHGGPTVEVIGQWKKNFSDFFDSENCLIYDEWKRYYDYGFTTILSGVFDLTEDLRQLQKKLCKISGYPLHANFYFSKGSVEHRVSFDHHNHEYGVIIKLIYGKCIIKIDEEYVNLNAEENSAIYIPAGTNHSVVECEGKKLSLTVNLG